MYKPLLLSLVVLSLSLFSGPSRAQTPPTGPYFEMQAMAKTKRLLEVQTPAGMTRVILTSVVDKPRFLFLFVPGGPGGLRLERGAEGGPRSASVRNPIFAFAPEFLKREAGWAAIDVPQAYGAALMPREQRLERRHVEAVEVIGRTLREVYPEVRLILVGHSNGGITAGLQAVQAQPVFDAVVLSAPQLLVLPRNWKPENARVPLLFITHRDDACVGSTARQTVAAAGKQVPVVVIEKDSSGPFTECFSPPAPHFYTDVIPEFTAEVFRWAASLK